MTRRRLRGTGEVYEKSPGRWAVHAVPDRILNFSACLRCGKIR